MKQEVITATEARIPLAKLTLSLMNPRQNVTEAEISDMAESLWAAGMIQNLAGFAPDPSGPVEIVAGGRRLRGLNLLAVRYPDLAETRPDLANPLVILTADRAQAEEWANVENMARKPLDPVDEIRAYGKMAKAGAAPTQIARAFAVTEKHVYRRLKLADLPAPVLEALQEGEIGLGHAAAFTVADDEGAILETLEKHRADMAKGWGGLSEYQIKAALKPNSVKGSDRRAVFVGIDAYKAAGGRIGGDLFVDETLFDDPDILDAVFRAKVDEVAAFVATEKGWKWAEAITDATIPWDFMQQQKFGRLYPIEGALTEKEAARYDELAELANSDVLDAEGETELAALEAKIEGDFSDEQKTHAGAIITIDREGQISVVAGLVRKDDRAEAEAAGVLEPTRHQNADEDTPKSPISQKLRDDLNRVAMGARQHAALRDPDLLIDLLAYQLSHALHWTAPLGITVSDVPNWPSTEAEGYALDDRLTSNPPREMYGKDLAKSFRAFRQKGAEHIKGELVRFLAAQLRGGDKNLAALIAKETQPEVREVWTPTAANFFSRVGGPYLTDLWRDLLDLPEDHLTVTTFAKLKKGEKAAKLEDLFADAATREALGLSAEQQARIAAWTPEGME